MSPNKHAFWCIPPVFSKNRIVRSADSCAKREGRRERVLRTRGSTSIFVSIPTVFVCVSSWSWPLYPRLLSLHSVVVCIETHIISLFCCAFGYLVSVFWPVLETIDDRRPLRYVWYSGRHGTPTESRHCCSSCLDQPRGEHQWSMV